MVGRHLILERFEKKRGRQVIAVGRASGNGRDEGVPVSADLAKHGEIPGHRILAMARHDGGILSKGADACRECHGRGVCLLPVAGCRQQHPGGFPAPVDQRVGAWVHVLVRMVVEADIVRPVEPLRDQRGRPGVMQIVVFHHIDDIVILQAQSDVQSMAETSGIPQRGFLNVRRKAPQERHGLGPAVVRNDGQSIGAENGNEVFEALALGDPGNLGASVPQVANSVDRMQHASLHSRGLTCKNRATRNGLIVGFSMAVAEMNGVLVSGGRTIAATLRDRRIPGVLQSRGRL
jgi:hypothetical protein